MKVALRVDASAETGLGHVMRCRNLAAELRERGADVVFLAPDGSASAKSLLQGDGYRVASLPPAIGEADDAQQSLRALESGADAIVLDHYGLGEIWERAVRTGVGQVLALEDIATRRHDVDVLVDQNYSLSFAEKYKGLIPATARTYFGPRYALLSRDYRHGAPVEKPRRDGAKRVLISFGGTDAGDVTGQVFAALSGDAFTDIEYDVVIGNSYPHRTALAAAVARRTGSRLHVQLPTLAPLLGSVDLAIGAAGVSAWERFSLGVPTILISLADNQFPASRDLDTSGIAVHLGRAKTLDPAALRDAVRHLRDDDTLRARMALQGQLLVDGFGARRIAEVLHPTPGESLRLRKATMDDIGYVFDLSNMPDVRAQSLSSREITWPEHKAWFAAKLSDAAAQVWVLDAGGLRVGQIRIDRRGADAYVSYSLDPIVRGRGWGLRLMELGLATIPPGSVGSVIGEVKPENQASRTIFERLGFTSRLADEGDRIVFVKS